MTNYYNLNQIIKVIVQDKEIIQKNYTYHPAKSYFWGLIKTQEKIRCFYWDIKKEELDSNLRFDEESKAVVEMRYIQVRFPNDVVKIMYYLEADEVEHQRKNLMELLASADIPISKITI